MKEYFPLRKSDSGHWNDHDFCRQDGVVKLGGLSVLMATMFVSGELAGTGVLALPQAVAQAG